MPWTGQEVLGECGQGGEGRAGVAVDRYWNPLELHPNLVSGRAEADAAAAWEGNPFSRGTSLLPR